MPILLPTIIDSEVKDAALSSLTEVSEKRGHPEVDLSIIQDNGKKKTKAHRRKQSSSLSSKIIFMQIITAMLGLGTRAMEMSIMHSATVSPLDVDDEYCPDP